MRTGSWLSAATVLALILAACDGDKTWGAGQPPVGGGNHGGSTGETEADAEVPPIGDDGGAAPAVSGVVCEVVDVRFPGNCTPVGRADLVVGIEDTTGSPLDTTMTLAGGAFSMPKPTVDTVWLTISDPMHIYHFGAQVVPIQVMGASGVAVPVIKNGYYDSIIAASMAIQNTGNGVVMLHLEHGDTPLANAVLGPLRGATAYYDRMGDSVTFSTQTPTTTTGFAVWFDVPPALNANYNVTVGGVITPHVGSAYADAVTFLSDVN